MPTNAKIYIDQGGSTMHIASGATVTADSGSTVTLAGTTSVTGTISFTGTQSFDEIVGNDASLGITGIAGATGAGGAVVVTGGAGDSGAGGAVSLIGGAADTTASAGGAAVITGGAGASTGAGGAATITAGASGGGATGNGGAASLAGGAAASTNGTGGAASLVGGVATGTGTGGAITITAGASAGAGGTAGAVSIDTGAATGGTGAAITIGGTNATKVTFGALIEPDAAAGAASANGLIFANGTAADPCLNAVANKHFVSLYMKHSTTSGDNRGIYTRTEFSGVGGGGDGIRSNAVVNAAGCGTVQGLHASVENSASAKITGLGVGGRFGYIFADEAAPANGTYTAAMCELWANGASTTVSATTQNSILTLNLGGNGTGTAAIDASANTFVIAFGGMTAGSGNLIDTDITTHTAYGGLRVYVPGVGTKYVALVSD